MNWKTTLAVGLALCGSGVTLRAAGADQSGPPSLDQRPNLPPELHADILMARKMYREAIGFYKEAGLDSPVILNKTGIAYHQLNEVEHAKWYYERATKLNPDYAEAINNIGTIYYAKKSYRRAITYYKKALEIEPRSASFLSNLGTAYFARKNYELALEMYKEALAVDPDVFENRSTLGSTLLERSVEERAKFHFYLAKAYAREASFDRALLYLRKALEEGFKDKEKILSAAEFAPLKDNLEFQQIMAMEQKVL